MQNAPVQDDGRHFPTLEQPSSSPLNADLDTARAGRTAAQGGVDHTCNVSRAGIQESRHVGRHVDHGHDDHEPTIPEVVRMPGYPGCAQDDDLEADGARNSFGPHYTVKQVMDLGAMLIKFDADLSGDIDGSEWMTMLHSFRPMFDQMDLDTAQMLFNAVDQDDSGHISVHEILPIIVRILLSAQKGLRNVLVR